MLLPNKHSVFLTSAQTDCLNPKEESATRSFDDFSVYLWTITMILIISQLDFFNIPFRQNMLIKRENPGHILWENLSPQWEESRVY